MRRKPDLSILAIYSGAPVSMDTLGVALPLDNGVPKRPCELVLLIVANYLEAKDLRSTGGYNGGGRRV